MADVIPIVIDLLKHDRLTRFLLGLLIVTAVGFALPEWSVWGVAVYALGIGYRA